MIYICLYIYIYIYIIVFNSPKGFYKVSTVKHSLAEAIVGHRGKVTYPAQ
jgi:hypothetical protein